MWLVRRCNLRLRSGSVPGCALPAHGERDTPGAPPAGEAAGGQPPRAEAWESEGPRPHWAACQARAPRPGSRADKPLVCPVGLGHSDARVAFHSLNQELQPQGRLSLVAAARALLAHPRGWASRTSRGTAGSGRARRRGVTGRCPLPACRSSRPSWASWRPARTTKRRSPPGSSAGV